MMESLKEMCKELLLSEFPKVHMEIDGTVYTLEGPEARAFACGMRIVLIKMESKKLKGDFYVG